MSDEYFDRKRRAKKRSPAAECDDVDISNHVIPEVEMHHPKRSMHIIDIVILVLVAITLGTILFAFANHARMTRLQPPPLMMK